MTYMNLSVKQNHGHSEKNSGCQGEGCWGEMEGEIEVSRYKLLYTEWINNKVLLQRTISNIL